MSWSYRKAVGTVQRKRGDLTGPWLAAAAMVAAPGQAAEVYYQPTATLSAENDSNLDLTPGQPGNVQGYLANVGTLVGIATPNSDTLIRPRFEYRDYPKDPYDNRLEEYLDLRSDYRGLRSSASISATYDHQDDFNAEFSSALYSDFNPVQPTAPSTGKAVIGITRTSLLLQPRYDFKFSPTLGVGVGGIYQSLSYSPSDALAHVDFDYSLGRAFVSWTVSPQTEMEFGGFGSRYHATQVLADATGAGASFDLNTTWTQLFSTSFSAVYQHTNFNSALPQTYGGAPVPMTANDNAWGATFSAVYKGQISQFRANLGRTITPSGAGGIYVNDQVQFQYTRNLNERLAVTGAMIALRNHGLEAAVSQYDRTYLQSVIDVKWFIRPTWFVQGGYQYAWQKFVTDPDGALNSRVYIRAGYQGLGRQY